MSENKIERFLYLFKELEKEVIALSDIKSDDYVPFLFRTPNIGPAVTI